MSDHLRTPFAQTMDSAIRSRIMSAIQRTGMALPCKLVDVSKLPIVTVQIEVQGYTFPPIECPVHTSKYVREPFQSGDVGVVFPVGTYLGNISGLGSSQTSDFTSQGNLSTLVFFPTGATSFAAVDNNKVVVTGPNGTQIGEIGSSVTIIADTSGIKISAGGDLNVSIGGLPTFFSTHTHLSGGSGPPVPGS